VARRRCRLQRADRPFADDLADETLSRISKTLEQDGTITVTPQARFCYVIARFVLLEDIRREQRQQRRDQSTRARTGAWNGRRAGLLQAESGATLQQHLERLDHCLQRLAPEQRDLIVEYYRDTGQGKIARRRDMARWLGISVNALCLRASRIRAALESGMKDVLPTAHEARRAALTPYRESRLRGPDVEPAEGRRRRARVTRSPGRASTTVRAGC
jgi:DNA-directed RNA polymerase specialized sigma24 family protein